MEKKEIKLLFIVPYPFNTAPSQRLKFEQYFEYLKQNNIKIGFYSFITPTFRRIIYLKGKLFLKILFTFVRYLARIFHFFKALKYDIIYLHLEATPVGPPIFEYILYKLNKPIIYDIDDLVYLPHSSNMNPIMKWLRSKDKIIKIMQWSKHIIVCTEYLRKFALQYNDCVTNISSTIDTDKYFIKNSYLNDHRLCVGWSGSHSTSKYLHLLDNVLRYIQKKYNVKIKVIGDQSFFIPEVEIEAIEWNEPTEVEDLQEIDIGLYPLTKDEWVLGKSGLKALQYMGLGIPTICTPIGCNYEIIKDGENGYFADSDDEWIEKISILIENPDLRRKLGEAARKTVEEYYSVRVNAPRYLKIINDILPEEGS